MYMCLQYQSFENTLEKGEIARNEQFLLFLPCLLAFEEHSAILSKVKIVVCKPFQFEESKICHLGKG